nr:type II toxin-antitoxin system RelE/ParE family toxin [Photorhabdus thracensis]
MEVYWTLKAQNDLERIYHFACQYSKSHANDVLDHVTAPRRKEGVAKGHVIH